MTTPFELAPGYTVRDLPRQEFADLFNARHEELFSGTIRFDVEAAYTEAERAAIRQLNMAMREIFVLRWGIEYKGKLIGWTMGQQESEGRFLMRNTAIEVEHRRKGLYAALLPKVIEHVASLGYQIIHSNHVATNNSVIIPKLKAGFYITGVRVIDKFGVMVELSYYINDIRRDALHFRTGQQNITDELRPFLKL